MGTGNEARFSPLDSIFEEEGMDDAINERSSEDFAGDWIVNNDWMRCSPI